MYVGESVDVRVGAETLEIYLGGERLSSHLLAPNGAKNFYRTNEGDLPAGPKYREWDAARCREWATRVGEHTVIVISRIFESVNVEEQGIDAALAVLRLTRRYSKSRVEKACEIALESRVRSPRYAHLKPILETRQDQIVKNHASFDTAQNNGDESAGFVRGAAYYAGVAK